MSDYLICGCKAATISLTPVRTTHCGCSLFREFLVFLQLLVELSSWGILQDEIHTCAVIEIAIEPQNIRMPAEGGKRCDLVCALPIAPRLLPALVEGTSGGTVFRFLYGAGVPLGLVGVGS